MTAAVNIFGIDGGMAVLIVAIIVVAVFCLGVDALIRIVGRFRG